MIHIYDPGIIPGSYVVASKTSYIFQVFFFSSPLFFFRAKFQLFWGSETTASRQKLDIFDRLSDKNLLLFACTKKKNDNSHKNVVVNFSTLLS